MLAWEERNESRALILLTYNTIQFRNTTLWTRSSKYIMGATDHNLMIQAHTQSGVKTSKDKDNGICKRRGPYRKKQPKQRRDSCFGM
jgi:wobble nucleotide-excising tRNase